MTTPTSASVPDLSGLCASAVNLHPARCRDCRQLAASHGPAARRLLIVQPGGCELSLSARVCLAGRTYPAAGGDVDGLHYCRNYMGPPQTAGGTGGTPVPPGRRGSTGVPPVAPGRN